MIQSYRTYFNYLIQKIFQNLFLGMTDVKQNNTLESNPYRTYNNTHNTSNIVSTQQLTHVLVNYLTFGDSKNTALSKNLSMTLFQKINSSNHLTPTIFCFKRLFTLVDFLHKPATLTHLTKKL